jgi:hypothetical protein
MESGQEEFIYTEEEIQNIAGLLQVLKEIRQRLAREDYTMEDVRKAWQEGRKLVE